MKLLLGWLIFGLLVACVEVPPLTMAGGEGAAATGGAVSDGGAGGGAGGDPDPLPVCKGSDAVDCVTPTRLVAGGHHTCAGMSDGSLRCWGSNDSHQLGDPTAPLGLDVRGSIHGVGVDDFVTFGIRHGCARVGTTVGCWGRNTLGQLGTGDYTFHDVLTPILDDVVTLATGTNTACAVRASGGVLCWGLQYDTTGWIDNDLGEHSIVPAAVAGISAPAAFALGSEHGCAVRADRMGIDCWGNGGVGQLGHGETTSSAVPVAVSGLALPVAQVASASEAVCSVGGDPPIVQCWGLLPNLTGPNPNPTAVEPQPSGDVVALQAGWRHACALLAQGQVQCWGFNAWFALGNPGGHSAAPVTVEGVDQAVDLAVGRSHGCALRRDGVILCWGRNHAGQLGRKTDEPFDPIAAPVVWP